MASSNPADVTGGNYNRRVAIYQYPAELGSPEYPHFITFTNRRSYTTTVQTSGGGRNQAGGASYSENDEGHDPSLEHDHTSGGLGGFQYRFY